MVRQFGVVDLVGETPNLVTLGAKRPVSSPWALYREVQC